MKKGTSSILFKMGLRSVKSGWKQFLSIIAIGAIAMTLLVGLLANAQSLENRVNYVYSEGNLADMWVTTSKHESGDREAIEKLLEDGESIDSRLYMSTASNGSEVYLGVYQDSPKISKYYGDIDAGDAEFDETDYFLMDKESKKGVNAGTGYNIGDKFRFPLDISSYGFSQYAKVLNAYLKKGKTNFLTDKTIYLTTTVTGFMSYPENITKSTYNTSVALMADKTFYKLVDAKLRDAFEDEGVDLAYTFLSMAGLFNYPSEEEGWHFTNPNQYLLTLNNDSRVNALRKDIQDYFKSKESNNLYLVTSRTDMPFYTTIDSDVTSARQFTFVFPFVFFVTAILVILTTLSQRILSERLQIGTMKAMGLSKGQIYWYYIGLTLILVGIGTVIGLIVGPLLIPKILGLKYSIVYSLPALTYTFPWLYASLASLLFLGIGAFVTWIICRSELSLKPAESMRPKPPSARMKPKNASEKGKSVFALSAKMAFRNIRLSIDKSIMVVIGVAGCAALLVCGFGIGDTCIYGIDHDVADFHNQDISVEILSGMKSEEAKELIGSVEGVGKCEGVMKAKSTIYLPEGPQTNANFWIIEDDSKMFDLTFGINEIAISTKVANAIGAKVGDNVTFQYNNNDYNATVGAVYEAFAYNGAVVHMGGDFFSGKKFNPINYGVYVNDGYNVNEVAKQILAKEGIKEAETADEWRSYINGIMSSVVTMANAVKTFAVLLALVVVYNLSLMNYKERMRDIATLKVLGFTRSEIALSLLLENLTLTIIGVAIGLACGYPFLLAVMGTNKVELVEYLYFIKPVSYVYSFLLTFVVTLAISIFLSVKVKKIAMVESLKSVE